jgi:hypothetical protein
MDRIYHVQLLTESVGSHFSQRALEQVIAANLGQDALPFLLGGYPEYHFDNNQIARSLAYVEAEHALIGTLAASEDAAAQRAAFGRLTHTVHDFYAHSNYVDLWLETNGGLANTSPEQIDALVPQLLGHPRLMTGTFHLWFDTFYYLPGLRPFLRRLYVRPGSHEAMNLDSPQQGPKFDYAMVAARQRTLHEYGRAAQTIVTLGGERALQLFHNG